jgi:hypothetical protein
MLPAFDRSQSNGVNDDPGFKSSLDREQAGNALQHCHWLSKRRANGGVPPFLS